MSGTARTLHLCLPYYPLNGGLLDRKVREPVQPWGAGGHGELSASAFSSASAFLAADLRVEGPSLTTAVACMSCTGTLSSHVMGTWEPSSFYPIPNYLL